MKCPHCERELDYVTRRYQETIWRIEHITIEDATEGDDLPPADLGDEGTLLLMANMRGKRRTVTLDWGDTEDGEYDDPYYPDGSHSLCCPYCNHDVFDALEDAFDALGSPVEYPLEEEEEEAA